MRREEVLHKPERNKKAPVGRGEQRECASAGTVSETKVGRVEWKLERNILCQGSLMNYLGTKQRGGEPVASDLH